MVYTYRLIVGGGHDTRPVYSLVFGLRRYRVPWGKGDYVGFRLVQTLKYVKSRKGRR